MNIEQFAVEAARKYLQSIVFVDDEIYSSTSNSPVSAEVTVTPPTVFSNQSAPKDKTENNPVAPENDNDNQAGNGGGGFHSKQLVRSFARERMVCALYEPEENFSVDSESEIFKLCERADAIILDWEFHKVPGTQVKSLLANLVGAAQTAVPHHVRLCAIYTSKQNLKHVAQELFDHLNSIGLGVNTDGEYNLTAGSSRIVVLGKPTTGRPQDQQNAAEVAEENLAKRIIKEFATMHEGILPSMALHGLASVRTNAKKILDKFHRDLDGAFLVHRGLILPDDDAFEQVPELLAEEALAVMNDDWIKQSDASELTRSAMTDLESKVTSPDSQIRPLIEHLKTRPSEKLTCKDTTLDQLHVALSPNRNSAKASLAALYTSRTQYGNKRALQFGTIVRYMKPAESEESTGATPHTPDFQYAICLMPSCDCVRLSSNTWYKFPFWELKTDNNGSASKGIVVELQNSSTPRGGLEHLELFSMGKPRSHFLLDEFQGETDGMVLAKKVDGRFVFESKSNRHFEWVAQLKPSHAQRIAHDIGNSFSRVGVLEAEWLRRKAKSN